MTTLTIIKENPLLILAYYFAGLVFNHGRKHGGFQADMVLEKELRVLHLGSQAAEVNIGNSLST